MTRCCMFCLPRCCALSPHRATSSSSPWRTRTPTRRATRAATTSTATLKDAPYLNGELAAEGARATNFTDDLAAYNSQPHYIMMEAGTNKFADTTFTCDNDPLKSCSLLFGKPNWTRSTEHLSPPIETASLRSAG